MTNFKYKRKVINGGFRRVSVPHLHKMERFLNKGEQKKYISDETFENR